MQIEPNTTLPLLYKITDPALFSTTYYVRAVVRDTLTDTTLATINLTRSSDGKRYTETTPAPGDPTGLGRHIDITVSVYSDSGYSSYAEGLPEHLDKYVVKAAQTSFGGSGSGEEIDYKKIEKIVDNVVEERLASIPPQNIKPILSAINETRNAVEAIEIPKVKIPPPQFDPILRHMEKVSTESEQRIAGRIDGIHIPEPEKIEWAPVLDKLEDILGKTERHLLSFKTNIKDNIKEWGEKSQQTTKDIFEDHSVLLSKLLKALDKIFSGALMQGLEEMRKTDNELPKKRLPRNLLSKYFQ